MLWSHTHPLSKIRILGTEVHRGEPEPGFEYVLLDFRSWATNHCNRCPPLQVTVAIITFAIIFCLFSSSLLTPN